MRSGIKSEINFQIKCYIITVLIFFGAFCPKTWRSKIGFPIVFSKSDLGGGGGTYFVTIKMSEKAKHAGICPSFGGKVSEMVSSVK